MSLRIFVQVLKKVGNTTKRLRDFNKNHTMKSSISENPTIEVWSSYKEKCGISIIFPEARSWMCVGCVQDHGCVLLFFFFFTKADRKIGRGLIYIGGHLAPFHRLFIQNSQIKILRFSFSSAWSKDLITVSLRMTWPTTDPRGRVASSEVCPLLLCSTSYWEV